MRDAVSGSIGNIKCGDLLTALIQIVNASALKESAVATRQGDYIMLLTRMTVVGLAKALRSSELSTDSSIYPLAYQQ